MTTKKAGVAGNGNRLFAVRVKGEYSKDGKTVVDENGAPKVKTLVQGILAGEDAADVMDTVLVQMEEKGDVSSRVTEIKVTRQPDDSLKWGA